MKFRKKPVTVEAMQLTPWTLTRVREVAEWTDGAIAIEHVPDEFHVTVRTLEGSCSAKQGDWIIKGVRGEFYPCDAEVFALTYDEVIDHRPFSSEPMPERGKF